jgi:hypothetical protein
MMEKFTLSIAATRYNLSFQKQYYKYFQKESRILSCNITKNLF